MAKQPPFVFRLLLDEGLPYRAAALLRQQGIDTVHVREVGLASEADEKVLEFGDRESRTCVTLDRDFHRILALTGASARSAIRIRAEGLRHNEAAELISRILAQLGSRLESPLAVTATRTSLRIRRLPLPGGAGI